MCYHDVPLEHFLPTTANQTGYGLPPDRAFDRHSGSLLGRVHVLRFRGKRHQAHTDGSNDFRNLGNRYRVPGEISGDDLGRHFDQLPLVERAIALALVDCFQALKIA
jgi:hypothetical protein